MLRDSHADHQIVVMRNNHGYIALPISVPLLDAFFASTNLSNILRDTVSRGSGNWNPFGY